jgi:23S rRNA G2069 N7-methylase RlmK/C1962 C5-methylase RlmI
MGRPGAEQARQHLRERRRNAHLHRRRPSQEVSDYPKRFAADSGADELMTVHYSDSVPNRLRSVELLAKKRVWA